MPAYASAPMSPSLPQDRVQAVFDFIDTDEDGVIRQKEFVAAMELLEDSATMIDFEKLFNSLDGNSDGELTVMEFKECFRCAYDGTASPSLGT